MNETIEQVFEDYDVPVAFAFYEGHGEPYIVYSEMSMVNSLTGDNELLGYVSLYDFDVYSKGDYTQIIADVKARLKAAGFVWQPSMSSGDMYDYETGYFHKTLSFAIERSE